MPFDSTFPATGAALTSAPFRNQFTSLKSLIDAQAALITTLQQKVATLESQVGDLQTNLDNQIPNTARNPNGQFVNFDPNWQPSGDTTTDCIYLRDRLTDLYNIEAR